MKRLTFLITLLFTGIACFPQQGTSKADSLRKVLKQHLTNDSNRVLILLNLSDAVIYDSTVEATAAADTAMMISQMLKWPKGIALSYRQKGNIYYLQSRTTEAMDCFQKALIIGEPLHNQQLVVTCYNNLANIYSDLGQFSKALDYYDKLLAVSRELKQVKDETIALINMGTVYTELSNFEKALDCFSQSLALAEKENNSRLIPFILNNIGITLDKKGDYAGAIANFQKSILLANSPTAKSPALEGISKTYVHLKQYDKAEQYALESLKLAQQVNLPEWLQNTWQALSLIYEEQHQYNKALDAYKNYISFRDSVMNSEKRTELAKKEVQFEYEKKETLLKAEQEKQQVLAQAEINRQRVIRNGSVAGAIGLLLAGFAIFIFYKRRRDAEEQKKEAEFRAGVADTEMKALRLQMNPHFIFNSLNSISHYMLKNDTRQADDYLTKFAKLMRMILENAEQKEVRLSDDLKALELYMQLEALRLRNKFSYEIRVDPALEADNILVPPLILQPFVENSIWHGISEKEGGGRILIDIKKEEDMLDCIVEDNGKGMKNAAAQENISGKKSFGMKITEERIDIINKLKKSKGGIELSDLAEGFRVKVRLPLEFRW